MELINKQDFEGADWNQYSDFEFAWIEILLTKNVFKKRDALSLLGKFGIRFLGEKWEKRTSTEEIGHVLIADVPKEELLNSVKALLTSKYKNRLTFYESEEIYNRLKDYGLEKLAEVYVKLSKNEKLKEAVREWIIEKKAALELNKIDLVFYILEELYRLPKKMAKHEIERILINTSK